MTAVATCGNAPVVMVSAKEIFCAYCCSTPCLVCSAYGGAALVNDHGKSQFQSMLQLFEGYLDKKGMADKARHDKGMLG